MIEHYKTNYGCLNGQKCPKEVSWHGNDCAWTSGNECAWKKEPILVVVMLVKSVDDNAIGVIKYILESTTRLLSMSKRAVQASYSCGCNQLISEIIRMPGTHDYLQNSYT